MKVRFAQLAISLAKLVFIPLEPSIRGLQLALQMDDGVLCGLERVLELSIFLLGSFELR